MSELKNNCCNKNLPPVDLGECKNIYVQNPKTLEFHKLKIGEKMPERTININMEYFASEEQEKKLLQLFNDENCVVIDTETGEKFKLNKL
jgi:hypothetical protein